MVYLSKIPGIQCKQKEKTLWGVLHIWGCTLCRFKFILWTQSSASLYALPLSLALKWGLISSSYLPQTSKCFQRSSCFHFSQWHHNNNFFFLFSSVPQSCPALCDPMNCSTPGLPVHHKLPEPTQTHVHWVGDAIQPSHLLSSPSPPAPSIFPSIRVFSNESALGIRWPKYCSFSFNISPLSKLRLSLLCLKNKQTNKKKKTVCVLCVYVHTDRFNCCFHFFNYYVKESQIE